MMQPLVETEEEIDAMDETLLRDKEREAIRTLRGTRAEYSEVTESGPDAGRDTHTSADCATPDCVAQSYGQVALRETRKKIDTVSARVPFLSTCPKCKHNQVHSYTRAALLRLLNGDHPVEGYCVTCDEYWRISAHERAVLGIAVGWTRAFHGRS
jgi:hypothetical protein